MAGLALVMNLGTFSLSLPKWPHSVVALCYPVSMKVGIPKVGMSISSSFAAVSVLKLAQWEASWVSVKSQV